jgi:hypothetical protein
MKLLAAPFIFALRLKRAWRLHTRLGYTWRISWAKAGYYDGSLA